MNAQRNENDRARRDGGGDGAAPAPEKTKPETPDAPPRPRRGLGRLFALLVAAGVALLLYNYWGFWEEWGWFKTTQQAPPALPPPAVTVAKPLLQELVEYREFTGQFEAVDFVDVRARVSGYLESINFVDGQSVKKGDLLFVIEPKPFELALQIRQGRSRPGRTPISISPRRNSTAPPSFARRTTPRTRPMTSASRK